MATELLKATVRVGADIKGLKAGMSRANKSISGFQKSVKNMAIGMGAAFGGAMVLRGIKSLGTIFIDFESQMSEVKAITNATQSEFETLKNNALKLGASTKFTAKQVGELSVEYGKLGFSTKEIINASEATLNLAAATKTELARAAEVTGSTLRGFGINAKNTKKVTDMMAKSFTSSALNMEYFAESMKYVAPIARAANIKITTTTAILGKLADAGIKGTMAGTSLKNLMSKLADENSELSKELGFSVKNSDDLFKAFGILAEGNIDLTKATNLTDERSKAAFLTMLNGIDDIKKLEIALENSEGSAKKMADTMLNNLAGDIAIAKSAFQGFVLGIESGDGAISRALRSIVQGFTNLISVPIEEKIRKEQLEVITLTGKLTDLNTSEEDRFIILEKLEGINKKLVDGLDAENISVVKLRENVRLYNIEMAQTIMLAGLEKKDKKEIVRLADRLAIVTNSQYKLNELLKEANEEIYYSKKNELRKQIEIIASLKKQVDEQKKLGTAGKITFYQSGAVVDSRSKEHKLLNDITTQIFNLTGSQDEYNRVLKRSVSFTDKVNALKEILFKNTEKTKEEENEIVKIISNLPQTIPMKFEGVEKAAIILKNIREFIVDLPQPVPMRFEGIEALPETLHKSTEKFKELHNELTLFQLELIIFSDGWENLMGGVNEFLNATTIGFEALDKMFDAYYSKQMANENLSMKQKKELKTKAAKMDKAGALLGATVDTARAMTNAYASVPFPFNLIVAGIVGALGAIQIGMIASTPIPSFAEGGGAIAPTLAMIGDHARASRINPEVVMSMEQIRGLIGRQNIKQRIEIYGTLRGKNIYLSNREYARQLNRTT